MKKTLITIATTLGALVIVTTATYAFGTLTPSGDAGDDTQYTLNDIYVKIASGTSATIGNNDLMTVPGTAEASFRTLTEIYNAIPADLTLAASTTTVPVGMNRTATTLTAIDSDFTAANIANGTVMFGVTGTFEGRGTLEWVDSTSGNWTTASTTCLALVSGGHSDWRLPTIGELRGALYEQYEIVPAISHGFSTLSYWSGTEGGAGAYNASWSDTSFVFDSESKVSIMSVRCVR